MSGDSTTLEKSSQAVIDKRPNNLLAYSVCILAMLFCLYEFILQVSPAIMTHELMQDLGLNAATLGIMAAFYYYAYTGMQLPAGLLFDRFGPRRPLTLAILVCALGSLLFGVTSSLEVASIGRLLMGIGSAFAFIGALLLVGRWFPPHHFAIWAGLVQLMSSVGAIAGQAPLIMVINQWGWRHTLLVLGAFGVILALVVWLTVRDNPEIASQKEHLRTQSSQGERQRLNQVCGNRQTWLTALYSFAVWAPITAFTALWGIPFLVTAYGMSAGAASTACAMTWIGIGLGSPIIGCWSNKLGLRCLPLTLSAVLGVISLCAIIYVPHLSLVWLYTWLFIFGLSATGQALAFALVKDNNHPTIAGTAIGFNNMAVVMGGALFQPIIGVLLELGWSGVLIDNTHIYSVNAYRTAFITLPLCYLIAAVISQFFIKETHCQRQYPLAYPAS